MAIPLNRLFVYRPSPPDSLRHFVEFWSERYHDPYDALYTKNIGGPHKPEGLRELFHWKIGPKLFAAKLPLVERCFIDWLGEAEDLLAELAENEPLVVAQGFLDRFKDGGAIWRIFWLHCWDQRLPIYDQHVHRAMTFAEGGRGEELSPRTDAVKVQMYLDRYLPFFENFAGMDHRKVDQALWSFGRSLKNSGLPPLKPRTV